MRTITSRHNPLVREFRELADAADPQGARVLLDGVHLVRDARARGLQFEHVAVAESRAESAEARALAGELDAAGTDVVLVTDAVFNLLSPVRTPSGLVAIARRTPSTLADLSAGPNPFVVVAVDIQDPGNAGSLLRAAEAGGVTGALLCGTSANAFSWKALRGSMGSALRLPVVTGMRTAAAVEALAAAGLRLVASVARGGLDPDAVDWRGPVALLVGNEGAGLDAALLARCADTVTIPMAPGVESLNVAVAGAVLVYAARRQRV